MHHFDPEAQRPVAPPPQQPKRMIVVMAFDYADDGELYPSIDPIEQQSEYGAKNLAAILSSKHAGVIAWTRAANPDFGDFGEPVVLFQRGKLPAEME